MPAIARNGYLYGASPQVPIDAEDVRYDNSTSELESTDVQSAIGELKELIDEGGGSQVQSNWTETDVSSDAYIQNKPTLGSASSKNVPISGNASTTEVVMGSDTRLSDARNAADVYSWAKAETKPSYTAAEVGAIATTAKGANGGVAELDSAGKVPSSQLPSYVDDVIEYDSLSDFPLTGESGKIYVAKDTNISYRWTGTTYAKVGSSLALGETSSTAYAGNKGKANADAIAAIKDGTNIDSFGDVETAISTLQSNFQDGVDDIYDAVVAKGTTPASKSLSDVVQGIADIETATVHTETYTASSRASNLDMGESHEYRYVDTNSVPNTNASTYDVTSNGTKDMGSTNTNRYVNVNVPNTNASTYSVDSNGIKDMGATNSYRYVNVNVPHPTHTTTYKPTSRASNNDMGATHLYRYVDTTAVPNSNSGTYTGATSNGVKDMGATNTYRYVNVQVPNSNSGTYGSVTSNGVKDMGATNSYRYVNVNVPHPTHTTTYTPTSRASNLDMGATHSYRYVNTNSVPNTNSGTYTYGSGSTGGTVDMGATNTYRYVNASNVYSKGKTDAINSAYVKFTMQGIHQGPQGSATHNCPYKRYMVIAYKCSQVSFTSGTSVTEIYKDSNLVWQLYRATKGDTFDATCQLYYQESYFIVVPYDILL